MNSWTMGEGSEMNPCTGQAVLSSTVIAAPWKVNMTQRLHGLCKNGATSAIRMAHSRNRRLVNDLISPFPNADNPLGRYF